MESDLSTWNRPSDPILLQLAWDVTNEVQDQATRKGYVLPEAATRQIWQTVLAYAKPVTELNNERIA